MFWLAGAGGCGLLPPSTPTPQRRSPFVPRFLTSFPGWPVRASLQLLNVRSAPAAGLLALASHGPQQGPGPAKCIHCLSLQPPGANCHLVWPFTWSLCVERPPHSLLESPSTCPYPAHPTFWACPSEVPPPPGSLPEHPSQFPSKLVICAIPWHHVAGDFSGSHSRVASALIRGQGVWLTRRVILSSAWPLGASVLSPTK